MKSPLTTLTTPALSISLFYGPLLPNCILIVGVINPLASGATLFIAPAVGPPIQCLEALFQVWGPFGQVNGQSGPATSPGKHVPLYSHHPHLVPVTHFSHVFIVAQNWYHGLISTIHGWSSAVILFFILAAYGSTSGSLWGKFLLTSV